MQARDASGRRISLLNDDASSSSSHHRPAQPQSYQHYQQHPTRRYYPPITSQPYRAQPPSSSFSRTSSSSSPSSVPHLSRSDSYDSYGSSKPISPVTPVYDYGRVATYNSLNVAESSYQHYYPTHYTHNHHAHPPSASSSPYDDEYVVSPGSTWDDDGIMPFSHHAADKRPRAGEFPPSPPPPSCPSTVTSPSFGMRDHSASLIAVATPVAAIASRISSSSGSGNQGAKRYPCRYRDSHSCDKTFTTSGHASRHSKIHTAEKAVSCTFPTCNRKFTRADNMKQHLETHYKSRNTTIHHSHGGGSSSSSSSRNTSRNSGTSAATFSPPSRRSKPSSSSSSPSVARRLSIREHSALDMRALNIPLLERPESVVTSGARGSPSGLDALAMAVACQEGA